jgi:uncharacterized protein
MQHVRPILFVTCFLIFLASPAFSQEAIADEKRRLIAEIAVIFKMDTLTAQILDNVLAEMEKTYPMGFAAAVDNNPSLTPEEKARVKASSTESYSAFSRKFRKRMNESVDFSKYIQDSIYPLYDKFYTEQELRELVAFYRTPTGRKVIETLPNLHAESQKMAREKLLPQILTIVQDLIKEEFAAAGAAPPPKRSNP